MAEEQAVSATLTAAATQDEGAVAIGAVTATGTIQAGQQTATPTKVVVAILPTDTPIPTDTPTTTPTTTPVPVGQTPVDGTNDEPAGVPTDTPTDTPTSMSTSTPTSTYTPAPTNTPTKIVAVTQTPVPPAVTDTPTVTPTTTPTATPTKIVAAPAPIDGGASDLVFSTDPINGGRNILLPGFSPSEIGNPMIFRDRIGLALSIYAANASEQVAGAGVRQVEFVVTDLETGDTVHEQVESTSLYCLFGGNTLEECRAKTFAEMGYQWPNGKAIYNGEYRVDMFIETENDNGDWNISFFIEGAQDRPTEGEPEETDANFSGRWQTNAGTIDFQQSGNQVSGTYQLYGDTQTYTMQGTVTGNILDGTYTGYDGGSISFGLSPDGERFDGSWFYQGQGEAFHWCGVRSGPLWDGCGYSGNWESIGDYVPNYQPTMRLVQNGSQIQGTFLNGVSNNPGTVAGQVGTDGVGSQLTAVGSWAIDSASGTFRWRLVNLQSNQIAGRSITADGQPHQWCSWRPGLAQPSPCLE